MTAETEPEDRSAAPRLNAKVPHSARVWNYWLGGKDNFAVDRELGERLRQVYPAIADLARSDRQFLNRAVRYLAGEAGIRQFLDIGSGLPTVDNTHEVAQRAAPESRIVYVDNDPLVLMHARVLLTSGPEGATDYIEADFRDPDAVLAGAARTLDFTQPVAVMLLGVLGHFGDDDEVASLIGRVMAATAPGSYLIIAHGSSTSEGLVEAARQYREGGAETYHLRGPEQLARFFAGLDLVPPGLVPVPRWRPDAGAGAAPAQAYSYCAIGRVK
jgi:O-methyltransferase involved in polyketide biosynthesis